MIKWGTIEKGSKPLDKIANDVCSYFPAQFLSESFNTFPWDVNCYSPDSVIFCDCWEMGVDEESQMFFCDKLWNMPIATMTIPQSIVVVYFCDKSSQNPLAHYHEHASILKFGNSWRSTTEQGFTMTCVDPGQGRGRHKRKTNQCNDSPHSFLSVPFGAKIYGVLFKIFDELNCCNLLSPTSLPAFRSVIPFNASCAFVSSEVIERDGVLSREEEEEE
ncbi:hypothetical protein CAPTEDRAFT_197022 [Capitella teleta]|uniref:Uncharacterized protein n=1 Tax=Capitella teleta TaxID=283909 RepID=R7V587_CAPTE|nr:hypothetical protein CAPTEDRAFT_197022 [Capitella teleta]|eukprot:ELU14033.1 hypothetical protein CAPTEDRAFT_197022 [Capitella teleta]